MSLLLLPVQQTSAHFGFAVELDGVTFDLTFRWNDRIEAWFLDVADGEGTLLVAGVALRLGVNLLGRFAVEAIQGLPAGVLFLSDSSRTGEEAGFDDLGRRVLLHYWPAADLAALGFAA